MNEFYGASGVKRGCDIAGEGPRRLETKDRSYSLAAGEHAVTHGRMNGSRLGGPGRQQLLESGIDGQAAFLEKWGKFHRGREGARSLRRWGVTIRAPARDRTARRPACHRLSSREFLLAPPPLPVASGTRARERRPLRRASSRRPKRVGGSPIGGRLPQAGPANAQNRASSAILVSWQQVNSRGRPVSFSGA